MDRVTFEAEEVNLYTVLIAEERRLRYINNLFASGKLKGDAVRIVAEERQALEWLIPRLRTALARQNGSGNGAA